MLTQLRQQFDVIGPEAELSGYELVILPDSLRVDRGLAKKITAYVKGGGKLLATGTAGMSEDGKELLVKELPVRPEGLSPFTTTYVRVGTQIGQDVPASDHVMYERGVRVAPAAGATVLARVVEPYFERAWDHFSSHFQTPPERLARYPAVVEKGKVTYVAYPVFSAYAQHGNYPYRLLIGNTLNRLLPDPLVRVGGPTGLEVTVTRQPARTVVHLLYYSAERRTPQLDIVEDVVPLHDVAVSVAARARPGRVYLAPEGRDVPFEFRKGRVSLSIPVIHGHAMLVLE